MVRKKRRGEFVKGHVRLMASGKPVRVKGYKRVVKKSKRTVPLGKSIVVQYYQDPKSGRIASKRRVKKYRL